MTARELIAKFSKEFGFSKWPVSYEVDGDTYGHVCQSILDYALQNKFPRLDREQFMWEIAVGPNNGILFKGVELILKDKETDDERIGKENSRKSPETTS